MPTLPNIAVLPDKYVRGLNTPDEDAPPFMSVTPLETALSNRYATDAHFVTYTIDEGAEDFPRINKPCLAALEQMGAEVRCTMLVLDYDCPEHAAWTEESLTAFLAKVGEHENATVRDYTAFYTTDHGARFVYVLERPVPPGEAELRLQSLVAKFHTAGIAVDRATKDWTRLFRLPFVMRDGGQMGAYATWDNPLIICDVQPDNRLALDKVPALGQATAPTHYARVDADQPTPEEAEEYLTVVNDSGRPVRTSWWKDAKKMLHGRDCYSCIFEDDPIADHGERNPTVLSYAGQVVSIMYGRTGTTVQKCYALLLPAVMQLEGMDGNRTWADHLWHSVKHAWAREEGRAQARAQEEEQAEEEVLHGKAKILAGVRKWCKGAGYTGAMRDDEALWNWVRSRMILTSSGQYFVMRPDGYYARTPCRKDALPAAIRREGMDEYMHFWDEREDPNSGQTFRVERPVAKILSEHLMVFDYICGRANLPGSVLSVDETGQRVLSHGIFSLRTDIKPEFSKPVDKWLHALTGENYPAVTRWLAHSLDFTRPICAMSIVGPPSCGKGMLMRGLAECITTKTVADGHEIVADYQYEIQRTPFLNIDEGFPKKKFGHDAADNFRRWVGGGAITVNAKFQIPLKIQSPLRVILTANNHEVVRAIAQGKTLSIEDRDAIASRIFHWEAPRNAGQWLEAKGGFEHTAGWIDGDDGSPGNATVARHLLWLYKNRTPAGKGRFLVSGQLDSEVVQDMALESGIMLDVIETIIAMVSDEHRCAAGRGLHVDEEAGSIYVLSNAVVDYWNQVMRTKRAGRGQGLHHRSVTHALRTLMRPHWTEGVKRIARQQGRWVLINNTMLMRAALNNGFNTEKLGKLMDAEERLRDHETV
jgi:hypothetical protein